ncbi:MAG: tyrosine-type recombinase/integrase [Cyanobacteria bacterium REEB446]|nr:tyrosine-type recombinase/integrase [Cyanobacteria bacterium REEB446]
MQVVVEFLDYLENFSGLSYNTLRLYKRDLIDFSNFVRANLGEDFKIIDLNADNLECFSQEIRKSGASTAAVNRKLTAVHKMWNWLKENSLVSRDPFTQIVRDTQYRNKKAEILSEEEVDLLLSKVKNEAGENAEIEDCEQSDLRTDLLLELLYSCGLRVNELLALTIEDISFAEEIIFINRSSTSKSRLVPMIDSVKLLLEKYISDNNLKSVDRLFNISAREVYRTIQAKAEAAGIEKKISASILRNSFIKHMKTRGAHQVFLQDIMGQKNFARIE